MREPHVFFEDTHERLPFSVAPINWLQWRATQSEVETIESPDGNDGRPCDHDFRRRYAAILLKERGQ